MPENTLKAIELARYGCVASLEFIWTLEEIAALPELFDFDA